MLLCAPFSKNLKALVAEGIDTATAEQERTNVCQKAREDQGWDRCKQKAVNWIVKKIEES